MKLLTFGFNGRLVVCFATLAAVLPMARADIKMVSQIDMSVNGDFHPTRYATTYYKGKSVRIDSENKTLLSNSETHKTFTIDHLHKSFSVSDEDPATQASAIMKMMDAKVTATVTPTEDHMQIVGLDATKYLADFDFELKVPNAGQAPVHLKIHMETWATTELPVTSEGGAIVDSPNDMIKSLISLATVGEAKQELLKIKGFALTNKITASLDAPEAPAPLSVELDYQCVSLSQDNINPAMFTVPNEYKNADWDDDADTDDEVVKQAS